MIFNLQSFTKYLKLSFLLVTMYLLTARFVKSSHIQARILFFFLKNHLKQTLNSFNIKFQPHSKYQKSSCEVRQNLALFCNSIAQILGWNCVKDPRVITRVKEIKFEGVWGELEANKCFQRRSFTKFLTLALIFMWHNTVREKCNFCFWGTFC